MALVRKLQNGDKTPDKNNQNSLFEKSLYDDLYSMSTKEARRAKPAYDQVAALIRSGAMDKALKFNPDKTYSIDINQLPEELKQYDWQGHENPLEKDLLGLGVKVRGKDTHQEALTAAFSALRKSMETPTQTTTSVQTQEPTQTGYSKSIQNLGNYIISKHYANNPDVFGQRFRELKTDDERKAKLIEYAKENLNDYLSDYEKNKGSYDFKDYEKAQQLNQLLNVGNNDWNSILKKSDEFGWNLTDFLLSPEEKVAVQQQQNTNTFTNSGLTPEQIKLLSENGYTLDQSFRFNKGNIDNIISQNRGLIVKDSSGRHRVLDRNLQPFNYVNKNPFSKNYGESWENTDQGYQYWTPQQTVTNNQYYLNNKGLFQNNYENIGKEILTSLPDKYKVYGWSNEQNGTYNKDIFGNRDFTRQLTIVDPYGKRINITPKDNKYIYNGKEFTLKGFGNTQIEPYDPNEILNDINNPTSNILSKQYYTDLNTMYRDLNSIIQTQGTFKEITSDDDEKAHKLAASARYYLIHGTPEQKRQALDMIGKLGKFFKESGIEIKDNYKRGDEIATQKKGGIIKAQQGLSFKEYKNKYKPVSSTVESIDGTSKPSKYKDIRNTWKGQSTTENVLDVASTAGAIASFVPGLGAAGATVTLGADIAKDIAKDGFQWSDIFNTNTAINAGFVGLSLIGLGGIKSLLKAGKIGKEGFSIGKAITKAEKLGKVLTPAEKTAINEIKILSETHGAKTTADLLNAFTKVGKTEKDLEKGLKALETVRGASTPILGSQSLGIAGKSIGNALEKAPEKLTKLVNNKIVRNSVRTATMLPGIMAVPRIASTIKNEGIEYTNPEDFKSIAIAGSIGKNWLADFKGVRAIERQAVKGIKSEAKTTFKLGDKEFEVNKLINQTKTKKLPFGIKNKKLDTKNLENETKLKDQLLNILKEEGKVSDKELKKLKDLKLSDLKSTHEVNDNTFNLKNFKGPENVTGNRTIDTRDYELAKKYLNQYQGNLGKSITKSTVKPEKIKINKASTNEKSEMKKNADIKMYKRLTSIKNFKNNRQKNSILKRIDELKNTYSLKNGGVLKLELGKTLPEVNVSGKDLSFKPKVKLTGLTVNPIDVDPLKVKSIYEAFNIKPYSNINSEIATGSSDNLTSNKFNFNDTLGKIKNLDKVDLMNLGLYANTLSANKIKANKDIQAYLNIPLKTLLPNQQLINYNPYGQMANEVQSDANRIGRRMAATTSNMNANNAAQSEMWSKGQKAAEELRSKGAATTANYLQNQENADYKTRATNINIADANQAAIKEGQSKALMTEGLMHVANNAALNNLLLSFQKNADIKNQKQYQTGIFNILNNPEYKQLTSDYNSLLNEDETSFKKNWQSQMNKPGVDKIDWTKSVDYLKWQNALKEKEKMINPYNEKLKALQTGLIYGQPYSYKKGGGFKKKVEANRRLFYKAIDGVNDLINSGAIDLSKPNKNILDSDKLFYKTIRSRNKAVSKSKK